MLKCYDFAQDAVETRGIEMNALRDRTLAMQLQPFRTTLKRNQRNRCGDVIETRLSLSPSIAKRLHTNGGGRPMRFSGIPCCSIWYGDIGDT